MSEIDKNKTVLVTGGAGFIGSHLAEKLLQKGFRVVVLDNFNDYYDPEVKRSNIDNLINSKTGDRLDVCEGDIRDKELVGELFKQNEFAAVFHLAAMAGVRGSIKQPTLYFDVNIGGTVNILNAIVASNKPKLIFASSSSVYGGSPVIPFSEDDPVNSPVSPYAASKKAGELICHTYHHLYDLDITCLRFFTVYGPRQRPEMAIHRFTRRMIEGKEVPMFGDGKTSRDYTYIDDIISGILATVDTSNGYRIYNLGNNQPVELRDLIERIAAIVGVKPQIEQLPMPSGDVKRTWANIDLAKKDLNYHPKVNLDQGLRKFVEWYNQQ